MSQQENDDRRRIHLPEFGSIYLRGRTWWVEYWYAGKQRRESSGSTDQRDAFKFLKQRVEESESGKPFGRAIEKVTLADLLTDLENNYAANGKSLSVIKSPCAHLLGYFGKDCRAINITTDRITKYVTDRQAQETPNGKKVANGTINRSLAALKRAFHLAEIAEKVAKRPHISMLAESKPRQGFVSRSDFERLHAALPDDLKDPIEFLYRSAWRVGEMRSLEWRDVKGDEIHLRSENSKNDEPRILPLTRELAEIIARARERRTPDCPFVFRRADGQPIGLFRKSWATACENAKLGKRLVHDLRRSGVKNMIDAHVDEQVAMRVSGHKTASVFRRYRIVTSDAVRAALEQTSDYLAAQPQELSNVVPITKKRAS